MRSTCIQVGRVCGSLGWPASSAASTGVRIRARRDRSGRAWTAGCRRRRDPARAVRPADRQLLDSDDQGGAQGSGRRLEQNPAAGPAQRDDPQIGGAQVAEGGLRDFPSQCDVDAHAEVGQRRLESPDTLAQPGDGDIVIVSDVRRGADDGDAVGHRLTRHAHGVGEVRRAVVDTGQDVAVEVDQIHGRMRVSACADAPYRRRKMASARAMCAISDGATLSLGACMWHSGSSTP